MFIKEERITRDFPYTTKTGKQAIKKRSTSIAYLKCDNCGSEFQKQIGNTIDRKRCNNNVSHYCSKCPAQKLAGMKGNKTRIEQLKQRIGERTITENGYIRVYVGDTFIFPDHVYCGSMFEHTMITEQHINRPLKKGEVVHHIDGDKQNNNLDNLDVMTVDEHNKCHGQCANELIFKLLKDGIIGYDKNTKRYVKI